MKKYSHLTLTDRAFIEASLKLNHSFTFIASNLDKDISTISKEIRNHIFIKPPSEFNKPKNLCSNRKGCTTKNLCNLSCSKLCKDCFKCNSVCPTFIKIPTCQKLLKAPYVCNGCDNKSKCRLVKHYYNANNAHEQYRFNLVDSRTGINLSLDKLEAIDTIVSPLIKNGLSLNHILANNDIDISLSSFYRYIDRGYLSVVNLDLRKKLSYKPRKKEKFINKEYEYAKNRNYNDFLSFVKHNPISNIIEMDCVEGIKGGACLLTLIFRSYNLMLIYKLDKQTASNVHEVINHIENSIGKTRFKKYFPIILCDRGSEFKKPLDIEFSNGRRRTNLFYCDPRRSDQKGKLENNHRLIRYVLKKGSSFDEINQIDLIKLTNHINSYSRLELNNSSPIRTAKKDLPYLLLKSLGLKEIQPNEIILTPKLFK